ncbi:MAG: glycosyltransferase family 4 protein [Thermodesulfobacteriota bacterium]|nr:glycosyltransferase family 4 protein [Thermodesulfobacteriota bacterium]
MTPLKILYLINSANLFGGTPKKTLDLVKYTNNKAYIYFWSDQYGENLKKFTESGATVYTGNYGRNIPRHLFSIIKIIDENKIDLVQTQFLFGELLSYFIKLLRPKIKIVIAFVGPFNPSGIKKFLFQKIYKKVDAFIYISEYVKKEKIRAFNILDKKHSEIIYNGTNCRSVIINNPIRIKHYALCDIAGLIGWKNINILVDAMRIIIHEYKQSNIYLYIAGDGPMKGVLQQNISASSLDRNVFLLGYQENIGSLLNQCDIFLHPAYAEGFGIAVAEAMYAKKPIIVSNAGALPELIENNRSGLVVDPFDATEWANAIMQLINNTALAEELATNAKQKAEKYFSVVQFVSSYNAFYTKLLRQ